MVHPSGLRESARLAAPVDPAARGRETRCPGTRPGREGTVAMRAGPAGPPDDDQIPDTMGRPQQAHHVAAMLIRASVQTVVDVLTPPRVPMV